MKGIGYLIYTGVLYGSVAFTFFMFCPFTWGSKTLRKK